MMKFKENIVVMSEFCQDKILLVIWEHEEYHIDENGMGKVMRTVM